MLPGNRNQENVLLFFVFGCFATFFSQKITFDSTMLQNNEKQKITKTFSWFLLPGNIFSQKITKTKKHNFRIVRKKQQKEK